MTDIERSKDLASKGYSTRDIAKALGIGKTSLYKCKAIVDAIHRGHIELKAKVSQSFLENLAENPQHQQLLIKRLGLFNPSVNITKPTTAKEALKALSDAIEQYSEGAINESQLKTLEATLNSYVRGYEVTEIEARLKALEDASN